MTCSAMHRLLSSRRRAALALSVAVMLPACATVSLAPPPAPPPAPVVSDADRYPPPRLREPPPAPRETRPAAEAPAIALPSATTVSPLPAPAPAGAPSLLSETTPPAARSAVGPAPSMAAPAPSTRAAAPPPASVPDHDGPAAPGRWAVQVGVFAVAQNAETIRARVAQRLLERPLAGATLRTVRRDGRIHVLIGDLPDRASAQRLAAQVRELLQQDVALFRW